MTVEFWQTKGLLFHRMMVLSQNNLSSLHFYFLRRSLDTVLNSAVQGLSVLESHLVEVEGDTLCLYGAGALECLDRNWSAQTAGIIVAVSFTFIEFDEIVQVLTKLKIKFPNCVVRMPQISTV